MTINKNKEESLNSPTPEDKSDKEHKMSFSETKEEEKHKYQLLPISKTIKNSFPTTFLKKRTNKNEPDESMSFFDFITI